MQGESLASAYSEVAEELAARAQEIVEIQEQRTRDQAQLVALKSNLADALMQLEDLQAKQKVRSRNLKNTITASVTMVAAITVDCQTSLPSQHPSPS